MKNLPTVNFTIEDVNPIEFQLTRNEQMSFDLENVNVKYGTDDFNELINRPKYNNILMTGSTNIPEVKTQIWDNKYSKPSTGIPETDLSAEVKEKLDKAEAAVEKEIISTAGKSLIFNEADGGGAKFENNNGTASYVGVNQDTSNGIGAQLYDINVASNQGSKIDVTLNGVYYVKGTESSKTAAQRDIQVNEISTMKDINTDNILQGNNTLVLYGGSATDLI